MKVEDCHEGQIVYGRTGDRYVVARVDTNNRLVLIWGDEYPVGVNRPNSWWVNEARLADFSPERPTS